MLTRPYRQLRRLLDRLLYGPAKTRGPSREAAAFLRSCRPGEVVIQDGETLRVFPSLAEAEQALDQLDNQK